MKVLFLHGLESKPGGSKAKHLKNAGLEVLNPELPKSSFVESVKIAQELIDKEAPDVVVGSSRGGAIAMSLSLNSAGLVLIAPAWKRFLGKAEMEAFGIRVDPAKALLLHSDNDVIVLPDDSRGLEEEYKVGRISVGNCHRMSDSDALEAMLDAVRWVCR